MQEAAEALLGHWEELDRETRTEALNGRWYRESRRVSRALARKHGVTLSVAAGTIAALSPRVQWKANVRGADALLGGAPDTEVAGFDANKAKARRIMGGERPLDVLGGDKVRAFYRAIMGDENAAVIDVWMWRAIGVAPGGMRYADAEAALREAAAAAGVAVADFQAVVWSKVRGGAE